MWRGGNDAGLGMQSQLCEKPCTYTHTWLSSVAAPHITVVAASGAFSTSTRDGRSHRFTPHSYVSMNTYDI